MPKLRIPYAEFYITNVCNLACPGCNRFNNYDFRGYQRWDDYKEQYSQWAQEIDIGSIGILGGEPMLNPSFMQWVEGIAALWPNRRIRIISNGFHLNKVKGLYELCLKNKNIQLWIGIHNKQHKRQIFSKVTDFLKGPVQFEFNQDNFYQQYHWVTDANSVKVKIEYNWWFHQGAIVDQDGVQTLHNSDPEKAHNICHMKTCHHFIRGQLYKCGVVALLPEYDQQHKFALSLSDRELLNSYQPLSVEDSKAEFVAKLNDPIPQCKFCPESYNGQQIYAQLKKDLR